MPIKDTAVRELIRREAQRQNETLNLIASENYAPRDVLEALGSPFTNKYAEGYPGKRYYPGNEIVDQLENLAINRAKKLFKAEHANVQALSGGGANLAIYLALMQPGEKLMALKLSHGGHLSHGHPVNFSGKNYKIIFYEVDKATGRLDMDKIRAQAEIEKPKVIIAGASAYAREINWKEFSVIAKSVGAYLVADISHTAGLIAGGALKNPCPYADVVMTTTHKSLRGPRGAIILCKKELASVIDKSIFPGFQGGPHMASIAGIAVALKNASEEKFKTYAKSTIINSKAMAKEFKKFGIDIISGGTDTHLMVLDLSKQNISGKIAEELLVAAGITVSRSTIPDDTRSPMDPSGIRIGTPAMTTRGFKEKEFIRTAQIISAIITGKNSKKDLKVFREEITKLLKKFPVK
ncbi:MAG: serine hydroxymethyltransferase [Patescibacteria group bacterium]|nr:serine hydroxymethyltransferase [Patescibacteria group bacterium]